MIESLEQLLEVTRVGTRSDLDELDGAETGDLVYRTPQEIRSIEIPAFFELRPLRVGKRQSTIHSRTWLRTTGRHHLTESSNERAWLVHLDGQLDVDAINTQCLRLWFGGDRLAGRLSYTPDIVVDRSGQIEVYEIKGSTVDLTDADADLYDWMDRWCAAVGWTFRLESRPPAGTARQRFVQPFTRHAPNPAAVAAVVDLAASEIAIQDLRDQVAATGVPTEEALGAIYSMIGTYHLRVEEGPLRLRSRVWLTPTPEVVDA